MSDSDRVFGKLKSLIVADVDYDELEKLDKPCPGCGRDTLYREDGRFMAVDRCRECRFEGATWA